MPLIKASESIGLRLAKQESTTSFRFTKETEFIPSVQPGKTESKSKYQTAELYAQNKILNLLVM